MWPPQFGWWPHITSQSGNVNADLARGGSITTVVEEPGSYTDAKTPTTAVATSSSSNPSALDGLSADYFTLIVSYNASERQLIAVFACRSNAIMAERAAQLHS